MIELQTMNEIPIYTIIKIEAEEAENSNVNFLCKKKILWMNQKRFQWKN